MKEGKHFRMGESSVLSLYLREAKASKRKKFPKEPQNVSEPIFESEAKLLLALRDAFVFRTSGQPARLFASFLQLFCNFFLSNKEKSSLLGKKALKSFVH